MTDTGFEIRPGNDLLCRQCGITLRPFMEVCPRCGTRRRATAKLVLPELDPQPEEVSPQWLPLPQEPRRGEAAGLAPLPISNPLFSPDDERRFPRFTSAQWTLLVLGLLLLLVGIVIAWLLWRQQQIDEQLRPLSRAAGQGMEPLFSVSPRPSAGAAQETVPAELPDGAPDLGPDAATSEPPLLEAVQATLKAYNPFGYSGYRVQVKGGVVTLDGVVENLAERTAVENVVRLVQGVQVVVNRLRVRTEESPDPMGQVDRTKAVPPEVAKQQ